MNTKDIISKVKKIEVRTRLLVEGLLQGNYHSVFKGRGIEFNEVRDYHFGDDIRTIDWNVTARMNEPYVKEFIEERDLTVYIVFDVSASGEFGSEVEKKESAVEMAASLMFAAIRNNDRVGLILFTDNVERFIPARRGRKHVLKLVSEMISFQPKSKGTNVAKALHSVGKIAKKRSIIFVLSDFMSEDFSNPLSRLKKKHDIVCINIRDVREAEIPDVGYIMVEDEETGEQMVVNTSDPDFRKAYHAEVINSGIDVETQIRSSRAGLINIRSGEDHALPLKRFFSQRMRMVR